MKVNLFFTSKSKESNNVVLDEGNNINPVYKKHDHKTNYSQLLYYKYYRESGSCSVLLTDLIVHDFLPAKLEVTCVSLTNPLKL